MSIGNLGFLFHADSKHYIEWKFYKFSENYNEVAKIFR